MHAGAEARLRRPALSSLNFLARILLSASSIGVVWLGSVAAASGHTPWEMRVCSPVHSPPAVSQDFGGYDMDVAELLAEELGAYITYEWIVRDRLGVEQSLHLGHCDLVLGIGESVTGVVSSVPYLRAPYVFVSRADRDLDIASLDDPILKTLTIATYPAGIPSVSLRNRGMVENVRELAPVTTPRGLDRDAALLDAVISGEADVAIMYVRQAAVASSNAPDMLRIEPVTPELDFGAAILPLYRTFTIGVRPHDERFRDRINEALAVRWDDIAEIFQAYGMPTLSVSRPPIPPATDERVIRVGVIAPSQTRQSHGQEAIGEAIRLGAVLAENSIARLADRDDVRFDVFFASAPNVAATLRAADRLIQVHRVDALIGGYDNASTLALHELAQEYQVAYFNVGSSAMALRNDLCLPSTFHVEASTAMYLDALIAGGAAPPERDWYVVYEEGLADEELLARWDEQLALFGVGGQTMGAAMMQPRQFVYFNELANISAAGANAVLLILGAEATDQFLVQFDLLRLDADLAMVVPLAAQTREVMLRYSQSAPEAGTTARPSLWDTTLDHPGADDLNLRYTTRNAKPMESAAWASYAAVMSFFAAASEGAAESIASLTRFLTDPTIELDLGKGVPLSYRPWDHQLRQPLYLSQVVPEARWGSAVSAQMALGRVVATIPDALERANVSAQLDALGDDADQSLCAF